MEEKFITAKTEGSNEAVGMKNEIQTELIKRWYGHDDVSFEKFEEWKNKYSARFQDILDRMIKADPHFWLHNKETPNATLALFADELYGSEETLNSTVEEERFENK